MLPHELRERAARQTEAQASERKSWQAWCRVSNDFLRRVGSVTTMEVRIDGYGNNRLHDGLFCLNHVLDGASFRAILSRFDLHGEQTEAFLAFLDSEAGKALYDLEFLATSET